jgi:hypothetical protein
MSRSYRLSVAACVALVAVACDHSEASRGTPRSASAEPSVAAEATPSPSDGATVDADFADDVRTLQPRTTRAGTLRLTGPLVRRAEAAPILLERLVSGRESAAVRAALVEALPRTGGEFAAVLVDLLPNEDDVVVREAIAAALGRTDARSAIDGLRIALADTDAGVRAEAARSLGQHANGASALAELRAALSDADEATQLAAIRAIGALRQADPDVDAALAALLADKRTEIRLNALRALGRIDPAYARALPELSQLRRDADPRIAAVADELASGGPP